MITPKQRTLLRKADVLEKRIADHVRKRMEQDPEAHRYRVRITALKQREDALRQMLAQRLKTVGDMANEDVALVKAEAERLRQQASKEEVPAWIAEFIQRLCRGVAWGGWELVWYEGPFLCLRNPGGSYWGGIGMKRYAKSRTYLFDTRLGGKTMGGLTLASECKLKDFEGRVPKATLEAWRAEARGGQPTKERERR